MTTGTELRDATEQLNDLLKQAQADLVRGNLGVEAYVRIPVEDAQPTTILSSAPSPYEAIGFVKRTSDWILVFVHAAGEEVPLLAASRRARILGALHLDELRDQIRTNARELSQDLQTAIEAVRAHLGRAE